MTDDDICTEGTNRHRSRPAALDHWTEHASARGMLGVNNLRKINAGEVKVWTTAEARGIRLLRGGAREWKCWPVGPRGRIPRGRGQKATRHAAIGDRRVSK
ncbi:hypothetical protein pipiens_020535, partial [Culex pipiens pipiens]